MAIDTNAEEKLRTLQKEYDDFLYIVSHDLNTPIRGLSSLTNILTEELGGHENEEVQEVLVLMQKGVTQMQTMLAVLLEASRVERMNLEKEDVNLKEVINSVATELDHGEVLNISMPDDLAHLNISKEDAMSICHILIENVILHNKSDAKTLEIYSKINATSVSLHFKDNGKAIADKHEELIWKIFRTIDAPTTYHIGAGLYLLKKIMHKYNGSVIHKSNTEDDNEFILEF